MCKSLDSNPSLVNIMAFMKINVCIVIDVYMNGLMMNQRNPMSQGLLQTRGRGLVVEGKISAYLQGS
jgi:hypothetical protein